MSHCDTCCQYKIQLGLSVPEALSSKLYFDDYYSNIVFFARVKCCILPQKNIAPIVDIFFFYPYT